MAPRPPKVQLLGLLPAILKPCGPACAQPFTNVSVEALIDEERRETPDLLRENSERAHELAERLVGEFGSRLRIEVVGLESPRGIWLGLRHRVGRGFAVIVDGRDVFRNPDDYTPVRKAVDAALAARGSAEGDEQLGSLEQGTTGRARDRDDEEEEGDAHGARPDRDDPRKAPEGPGGEHRKTDQQDRLDHQVAERDGLVREGQGDEGDEEEA